MPLTRRPGACPFVLISVFTAGVVSAGGASGQTVSFASWRDYLLTGAEGATSGGSGPYALAVGDFNGDSKPDVAVANVDARDVRVLLNNGDGSFLPPLAFPVGEHPVSLATADFDGDSSADLVVALPQAHSVAVLLGNGDGTLRPPVSRGAGIAPVSVAVGDLDRDGAPDLVVANYASHRASVMLGNGNGTFQAPVGHPVGSSPASAVVADFSGDGKLDVATANLGSGNVSVLLGNGDGAFEPAAHVPALPTAFSMAAGDFNQDSRVDLVVTAYQIEYGVVLPGDGDGSFGPPKVFVTAAPPVRVTAADFNGDSRLDVASTTVKGIDGRLWVRLGRGDGTFDARTFLAVGSCDVAAAAADFDSDARVDLVTANYCGNSVSVLLGLGDGRFQQPASLAGPSGLCSQGGDFNGDSNLDLALCDDRGVSVTLGNGDGTFQAPNTVGARFSTRSLVLIDFNGDGHLDIAAGKGSSNAEIEQVVVLLGHGDGTFRAPTYLPVAGGPGVFYVAAGDVNGDLNADLIAGDRTFGTVTVLLGSGFGTFQTAAILETGYFITQLLVSDFNGDGKADFVIAQGQLFFGNGDGTFQPPVSIRPDTYPAAETIVAADFNGDTKQDIAMVFGSRVLGDGLTAPGLGVLLGNGDGTFEHSDARANPLGRHPHSIAAADYNGDQVLDLATGNDGSNNVSVLSGNGDGTFQPARHFGVTGAPVGLVVGQINGDGKPDIVVPVRANFPAPLLTKLINNTP